MACLNETLDKCLADREPSPSARTAAFDCSICLDFAADPVVTLCGHLYCWPCIYKWLTAAAAADSPQRCPVCKSPVSETALVPLYGRGRADSKRLGIPNRPGSPKDVVAPNYNYVEPQRAMQYYAAPHWSATAVHPLLWRSGSYSLRPHRLDAIGTSPRERRREMRVEESLRQIWMFLFCCAVLCLLFF